MIYLFFWVLLGWVFLCSLAFFIWYASCNWELGGPPIWVLDLFSFVCLVIRPLMQILCLPGLGSFHLVPFFLFFCLPLLLSALFYSWLLGFRQQRIIGSLFAHYRQLTLATSKPFSFSFLLSKNSFWLFLSVIGGSELAQLVIKEIHPIWIEWVSNENKACIPTYLEKKVVCLFSKETQWIEG